MNTSSGIYIRQADLNRLERRCDQIIKRVNSGRKGILLNAAKLIKNGIKTEIKSKFNKKTGNLLGSPYAVAYPGSMTSGSVAFAGIRPRKAPHAHLLEYGTVKMRAYPFVSVAVDFWMPVAKNYIENELPKKVEK